MASPTGEMTFWDHLDALRGVLLRVAAVMFCGGSRRIYRHAVGLRPLYNGPLFA